MNNTNTTEIATGTFGIIVYGSWLTGVMRGGEVGYSDWVRDARTFDSKEEAERFVFGNLSHIDQHAIAVVGIQRR